MQKRLFVCFVLLFAFALVVTGCGPNRVSKAKELMEIESYPEAIELLKEEIKANPDNGEAQFVYGQILRCQENSEESYERFNKAIKVDEAFKAQAKDFLLKDRPGSSSDYSYVAEMMPNLEKEDADFCYKLKVEYGSDQVAFVNNFPADKRASEVLDGLASSKYYDNRMWSKSLYQRLVRDYPTTSEGKAAKKKLADWWSCYDMNLPLDSGWHGYSISAGQRYRYEIVGSKTYDYGGQGVLRIDSDDAGMFIGSKAELTTAVENSYGYTGPYPDYDLMRSGSGTAPKSGFIWFRISTAGEMTGSFTVKIEYKD